MAVEHCILGKFLRVVCHCFPPIWSIYSIYLTCISCVGDQAHEFWCNVLMLRVYSYQYFSSSMINVAHALRESMWILLYSLCRVDNKTLITVLNCLVQRKCWNSHTAWTFLIIQGTKTLLAIYPTLKNITPKFIWVISATDTALLLNILNLYCIYIV